MARLIPRKQVEEVQDFIRDTSFAGNVTISGSLLVSQSFSFGNNPDVKSDITGSVFITGSLTVDGPLNVVGDQAVNLTASLSVDSLDSRLFGGIRPEDFGAMDATIYVSSTSGDDNNDGRTQQFPVRTIKKAAELATAGDDGRYGLPTGSLFTGFRIEVSAGTYLEDNPIELPRNTTVWGAGLRVTKILAKNENEDLFWVNSGCYLSEMTFGNLRVFPSVDNARSGFAIAFAPNAFITTSPYVQNCSMISNQENSFLEAYEAIPPGGGGLNVDGNRIHPDSPLASMVLDAYTQIAPNGVGCQVVGRGFIQLVSFFTNFSAYAVKVLDGGQAVLLNSNTSFGDFGMYSSGSRFITGSGGNLEAFRRVRDNYSIIVDTIENGLSAIPEFVPNTNDGIKVTDELQYFIAGNSSDEVAEQAKSEYRLVSNIVSTGISNIPSLLAKSATRGYNTGSAWNISNGIQTTGSVSATSTELAILDDRFTKVKETLLRGNRATASYTLVDNIDGLIKATDSTQYVGSDAATSDEVNIINRNFNTILKIVEFGLTDEDNPLPAFTSSNAGNIKVTETPQFITDISSSFEVQQKVSSSFAIVTRILELGSDYAPTIVQSSSLENPSIDFQNGYSSLLGNLSFIQEETIAYISSSWSGFEYDEVKCKRDVGFIVSGAAHDLLYGGNEESVRNGNFYYLFPSEATGSQLQQTLDAINYANGLAQKVVSNVTFVEPSVNVENAYDLLVNNKTFIQEEVIAFVSSSWRGFDYNEVTCKRDVGYIIDAVATDLRWGGNQRSLTAGEFYYLYPSEATTTQLLQTLDGIEWARDLSKKLVVKDTFVSPSSINQSVYDLIVENRALIQTETINFINTQFPNLVYLQDKCRRDTGFILDAVATDLLYGGNQKSIRAGLYYGEVPSKVNNVQLNETIDAISYAKSFVDKVVTNELVETPQVIDNTKARVRAGNILPFTASLVSGSDSERIKVSSSFGLVEDIIKQGEDSLLSAIAGNTPNFKWTIDEPKLVTNGTIVTSSADTSNVETIVTNYGIITDIITSGTGSLPIEVSNWTGSIKVTSTSQIPLMGSVATSTQASLVSSSIAIVKNAVEFGTGSLPTLVENTASVYLGDANSVTSLVSASSSEVTKVSSSFAIVLDIVENGTGSLPTLVENTSENIRFTTDILQITSSAATASAEDVSFISSSFAIVTSIVTNGTGSLPTKTNYGSALTSSNVVAAYNLLIDNISFIQDETIAYLSSSWSTASYDESKCRRDVGYIVSGAAEDLLYGVVSQSVVNGEFYYNFPSKAETVQLNQTIDGINYASRLAQKIVQNEVFVTASSERKAAWDLIDSNIEFIKDETILYLSSSWSGFDYNEVTCKRDVGYILDAVRTDVYYGGNERSIIAGEYYYRYPSQATVGNDGDTGGQLNQTLDGINYARRLAEKVIVNTTFTQPSQAVLDAKELLVENKQFIKDEVVAFVSSSWSEFSYNQDTCKRDVGYILDAAITDLVYGGNERSRVAAEYYYRYPSSAIVGGVPSATQQKDPTVDAIKYLGGISEQIVLGSTFASADSTKLSIVNSIRENRAYIQQNVLEYANYRYPSLNYNKAKCYRDVGFITDAIVTDLLYGGNARSIQAGTFYYKFPSQATGYQLEETINAIEYGRDLTELIIRGAKQIQDSFDVVVKIIESGSSVQTDKTIGLGYNGLPISQVGTPKNSYGDNLITTTIGTILPDDVTEVLNVEGGIKFNDNTQFTSSISASVTTSAAISESFRTVIDIIDYGISGSKQISGSANSSSYFEVISLANDTTAFYFNQAQLQYFDGRNGWKLGGEDTGSFEGSIKDPTLTLVRGEMYNFSVNDLGQEDSTINRPFLIKTKRTSGTVYDVYESIGLINNGITFGTITFTPLADTPDTLYYVNPNNVSASGIINIVDSLPLSDEQELVYVPTRGEFEKVLNTVGNIKISNNIQYTSSLNSSINERNNVSASFGTVINIIQSGSSVAPTIVKTIDGLVKRSNVNQITSSLSGSSELISKVSSSFAIVLDIIENGTGSLPTQIDNTAELIKVGSVTQFTTSSISASFDDIQFISESFEIVARMVEFGTGSYQTASLYGSRLTTPETVAGYNLIKQNIDFIQAETIAYLSSSWSTFEYNEASCSRDIGYIVSGAAEDLIHNVYSASIVNGKFYYEFPSEATGSQLNQTLDGIRYASRLAQNIASNKTLVSPSQDRLDTETIIRSNINFIKEEAITFLSSSWSSFDYNETTCKRDIGYILDAAITDIVYGGNERSIVAGEFYYRYPSSATDSGSQLFPTLDGIQYAGEVTQKVVGGEVFVEPTSTLVNAYELVHQNRTLIQNEVIQYISSSWNSFDYDDVKCRRDVGYILDATTTDLIYGGNERSVIAGDFYYRYPSEATGSQLNQTVDGIVYAQRLADKMMSNTLLVTASLENEGVYQIIERNRELVQAEVISYISSSWVGFDYDESKCSRDVGHILDAVATDLRYGGNERSVIAGEYYWRYPSDATEGQKIETIDGIVHAANLVQKLIQNVVLELPTADKLEVWNTIRNNRALIQNETIEYIDYAFPFLNYNRTKCRRDVGHILDGVATDVLWGGNQRSVKSGDFYYRYPSLATSVQLDETIAGIRYAESLLRNIVVNNTLQSPSLVLNTDGNIKVTGLEPTLSSIALSGSFATEVSSSYGEIIGIISTGISEFTPSTATYNPANGDFVMTIVRHGLSVGDSIYLKPESFTFTCEMDGNRTEHKLPALGQPAYDERLTIKSKTDDTITVNVGKSGPNVEFNPTNATYNPATGDFVVTVGEHSLSVGEGIVMVSESFAFTCDMDDNQSVKSYPRVGIDPKAVRSIPLTAVTDTTLTFNVGASGPNKYFTPVSASYNALTGDMTLTVSESFGLGVGRSVVLEDESFAFTCDQDGNATTHSYPRSGSDPYAGKSIVITSVGTTTHTVTDAPYDSATGDVTITIASHGFSNGDYIKLDDNSLTYTCVLDGNTTTKSYPRPNYDYPSGRWLEISNVTTNTFDINIGSSPYVGAHTFISATADGLERQDGTFTINVGDGGSASGSIHTFVSASQNAVKHEPQSAHTFVSASVGAIKHLPQSVHTFVRTDRDSVTTMPVLDENINGLIKLSDKEQFTSSSLSGTFVEAGYVTRSVGFINDIIRFGTDDIPFVLAKWYDDTLDVPQNLTTGSYVTASGDYTTTSEFGIVSSSFGQIISIIENGTGSLPTLVTNVDNHIKVTATTQFTSSLSGSSTEVSKVNASVGIIENIVQNGLSVKPTITLNNSDRTNLIKVTEVAQITSASFGDRLQQRLISSSIGVVLDIVENGTGSLPTIEPYGDASDAPKTVAAYNLLKDNIGFIQSESIAYLESAWSSLEYDKIKCGRDIGFIISGAAEDMLHNSISQSVVNGKFYYDFPSAAIRSGSKSPDSGSQLAPTLDGIRYAGRMAENIVRGYTYVIASVDVSGSVELIRNNKEFIKEETIAFISSSWSGFEYNQDTCKRDVGFILDAVATDLLYGGNERSVTAGDFYYRYPSAAIVGGVPSVSQQKDPTVTAIDYVQNIVTEIVSGAVFQTTSNEVEYVYDALRLNREFIQNETIAFVNAKYPNLNYNEASCRRDTGFIVDAVATDLRWGGNQRALTAGEFYYRFPSQATGYQLTETVDALVYARDLSEKIINKETLFIPTGSLNTDNGIKVTNLSPATDGSVTDVSVLNTISSSFAIVSDGILNGTPDYTPTTATYNPANGEFEMTIISHSFNVGDGIYLMPESFTFTCEMDGNRTEHNLPSIGQPAYNTKLQIVSQSSDTITVNVGASGPNAEFNPTNASYDPATGDFVVTVASHSLSVGEGIVMEPESFAFTCEMDNNQSVKSYPRVGIDPKAVRSIPLTAVTDTTLTFNVGASGPNKYFTPTNVDYNALTGDMTLTVSESFGLGVGRSVVLENESFAFTCDQDGNTTTHSYPRSGSDPYAEQSIVITSVGTTSHTVTDAPYDSVTGDVTITIANHGFSNGDYIKLDDNSLTYTCVLDSNTITKSYPRPNYDYPSGRWLEISNVSTNTFDINIGSSPYVGAHTFISATADGLERQDGTFTINVGNAGSASGSIHTFVSASQNAVKHEPQSVHTFVSASNGAIKHLPQSAHTFVRTEENSVSSFPPIFNYGSPLTGSEIVTAYGLITASVPFIQNEVIEYINSAWVGFEYNEASCSRDVGYIVNGVASDLLYGVVSASAVNAREYYKATKLSDATGSQRMQTFDGINYAYQLTDQIVKGVTFDYPSTIVSASVSLLRSNREFIQSESIAYLSSSWEGFEYSESVCRRDVGYIVDAVATDLLYGGNQRSKIAGEFYYKFPSSATSAQLEPTTTGIKYAGDVASKIVQNEIFVTASAERLAGNRVLLDNKDFIAGEVIQYVSSSWSGFDYNEASCSRDVGYIINAVATDFLYGGNERSREAGRFYYLYPSQATTTQLIQTIDGIVYSERLAEKVMVNETFTTASAEVSGAVALLRGNRSFIQNETIEYISSSWSNVIYNEDKCRRDTGYIVDAAATDLLYGGNERSVTAGLFYWRYPSRATVAGVPSEANQLDPTVDGIRFANGTAQNVAQNLEYTTPSTEVLNGIELLRGNTTFIQKETIAYLSSSWSEFEYNEVSCSRDLGYIIDAVATDLKYGGNERAVLAGTFYYYIPSIATTEQKPQTTDGIDFAKGLSEKVIKQQQLVFPFLLNRNGANALRANKKVLQGKAITYTNAAFPDFVYNEEKCYRDTGFIVDAIATDIIYGGNERAIRAAESYYNGVYGSAAVVITEQKKETAETNRYLRTQFQFVARQGPVEEFGSLIITTGHDFSYSGAGVTYKALPPNQGGDGIPDPTKEVVEVAGGRVFFTSGNELGDFKIGGGLIIKQASGTLEGRTFSKSLFSLVTPFSLALQD